jgi:hypothetical protein
MAVACALTACSSSAQLSQPNALTPGTGIAQESEGVAGRPVVRSVLIPSALKKVQLLEKLRRAHDFLGKRSVFGGSRPDGTQLVYSCQFSENNCTVFNAKTAELIGSLTTDINSPQGATVDNDGNLYIANSGGDDILVYPAGATTPSKTLTDSGTEPADVAVGGKVVAVSNITAANVAVYLKGSTTPSYTLTDPTAAEGYGVAFDGLGDCVWSFNTTGSGGGQIDIFPGCAKGATPINLGVTLTYAGGVAFDDSGDLVATDQDAKTVNSYALLGPSETTINPGFCDPLFINLGSTFSELAVADPCQGYTWRLSWPTGTPKTPGPYNPGSYGEPYGAAYGPAPSNPAGTAAAWHTAVMQSVIENYSAIVNATGLSSPPPEDEIIPVMFEAAQKVATVPAGVKTIMSVAVQQYDIFGFPTQSKACKNAIQSFKSGLPKFKSIDSMIAYFKKAEKESNSCAGWADHVATGVAILEDGKSTIYNSAWFAAHFNEYGSPRGRHVRPDKPPSTGQKVALADALGGLAGAPTGPGSLLTAAVGSSIEIFTLAGWL